MKYHFRKGIEITWAVLEILNEISTEKPLTEEAFVERASDEKGRDEKAGT